MTDRMTDLAADALNANLEANRPKHGYVVGELAWREEDRAARGDERLCHAVHLALRALTDRGALRLARDADDTAALNEAETQVYHEVLTHAAEYGVEDLVVDAGNGFGGPCRREIRGYPHLAIDA